MSALTHVVEVTDDTHGPLAEVAAVAALRRSAAALGIHLTGSPRVDWSESPFDPHQRFVTATARIATDE